MAKHVEHKGDLENTYTILIGKPEEKKQLER
jgi:hypothetical protein